MDEKNKIKEYLMLKSTELNNGYMKINNVLYEEIENQEWKKSNIKYFIPVVIAVI